MDCVGVGYVFDAATSTPADTAWYPRTAAPSGLRAPAQRVGELNTVSCFAARGQVSCAALGTETTGSITANVAAYSQDAGKSWSDSVFPAHVALPSPWGSVSVPPPVPDRMRRLG